MFGNFLGKKKNVESEAGSDHADIVEKVSKMNLTEMRTYVRDKITTFELSEDGLVEVIRRIVSPNPETMKLYLQMDDMDSKKKKAFDLILTISDSKKISLEAVELTQKFIVVYADVIAKFDHDYKEIYASRFEDAIAHSLNNMEILAELQRKMKLLGE